MRRQAEHAAEGAARRSLPGLDAGTRHPAGREDLDPVTDRKKKAEVLGKRFCVLGPESAGDRRWVAQDDTKGESDPVVLMVSTKALEQRQRHASMIRVDGETADERARQHGGADAQGIREGKGTADEFRSIISGDTSGSVLRSLPAKEGSIGQCDPRFSAVFRQPNATGELCDILEVAVIQIDVRH